MLITVCGAGGGGGVGGFSFGRALKTAEAAAEAATVATSVILAWTTAPSFGAGGASGCVRFSGCGDGRAPFPLEEAPLGVGAPALGALGFPGSRLGDSPGVGAGISLGACCGSSASVLSDCPEDELEEPEESELSGFPFSTGSAAGVDGGAAGVL